MTLAVCLVLPGVSLILMSVAWLTPGRGHGARSARVQVALVVTAAALLALTGLITLTEPAGLARSLTHSQGARSAVLTISALLAVAGGGPLTSVAFGVIDARTPEDRSLRHAGTVLRGGAWIGVLERAGVFATLVGGWPEGLAVVLGVKGLGRYPELRNDDNSGTAERFIIGTFISVLWAAACAGIAWQLA